MRRKNKKNAWSLVILKQPLQQVFTMKKKKKIRRIIRKCIEVAQLWHQQYIVETIDIWWKISLAWKITWHTYTTTITTTTIINVVATTLTKNKKTK